MFLKQKQKNLILLSALLVAGFFLTCLSSTYAQTRLPLEKENFVGAYAITVGYDKTTHLIFPYPIEYVDLGTADVLAEKVDKVENVLKIKANVERFTPTNLTVITGAGKYYSFVVSYEANPKELSIILEDFPEASTPKAAPAGKAAGGKSASRLQGNAHTYLASAGVRGGKAIFETLGYTYKEMDEFSSYILSQKRSIKNIGSVGDGFKLALSGLYIKENILFFHLHAQNKSNINYDIDFVRFYVKDKKIAKRTSSQQLEVFPLHVYQRKPGSIAGKSSLDQVYVLEKITIPDNKVLLVEFFEKKGGRHKSFLVESSDIVNARLLP